MKTKFIVSIIIGVIVLGTSAYLYSQMQECLYPSERTNRIAYDFNTCWELFVNGYLPYSSEITTEQSEEKEKEFQPKSNTPKDTAIENIKKSMLNDANSYEQWQQTIQKEVDEKNLEPFSVVFLANMKEEFEKGEKVSFDLINFGYRDWCLMPRISVYHQGHESSSIGGGGDDVDNAADSTLLYQDAIVHSCPPPMDHPTPRVSIWDEDDFDTFPSCQFEGTYTIWGESFEFDSQIIGSFYCNSPDNFREPETFDLIIPHGSSDPKIKSNFAPFELELRYGDHIKMTNKDDLLHRVILFTDRHAGSAVFAIRLDPGETYTTPVYHLGTFGLASQDENENPHIWMHGTVTVTEN